MTHFKTLGLKLSGARPCRSSAENRVSSPNKKYASSPKLSNPDIIKSQKTYIVWKCTLSYL